MREDATYEGHGFWIVDITADAGTGFFCFRIDIENGTKVWFHARSLLELAVLAQRACEDWEKRTGVRISPPEEIP